MDISKILFILVSVFLVATFLYECSKFDREANNCVSYCVAGCVAQQCKKELGAYPCADRCNDACKYACDQ